MPLIDTDYNNRIKNQESSKELFTRIKAEKDRLSRIKLILYPAGKRGKNGNVKRTRAFTTEGTESTEKSKNFF